MVRNEQWPAFLSIISQDTSNQHMIIILISPKHENNWVKKILALCEMITAFEP